MVVVMGGLWYFLLCPNVIRHHVFAVCLNGIIKPAKCSDSIHFYKLNSMKWKHGSNITFTYFQKPVPRSTNSYIPWELNPWPWLC